jgi:glycine/D-amino acid oxidase-like deaminating enzyme
MRDPGSDICIKVSGVKGARCAFSFTAAHLWPARLVHQLLGKILAKGSGLNVQANTPVTSVSESRDGSGKWTIETPRGSIKSAKIIHATNGYTGQLLPEYARSITPIRGVCSHITVPQEREAPHLVNTYAIRFDNRNYDYLIPRTDGSIIVGGARQRFWHNPARWFGTVRDDELVEEAVPHFERYMQRHFRGWENTQAKTESVWTGSKSTKFLCAKEACCGLSNDRHISYGLQCGLHATHWQNSRQIRTVHHCRIQWPWYASDFAF